MNLWVLVLATSVGCYLLKVAGYLIPARLLEVPRVKRLVEMLPIALLAALIVVQLSAHGRHLELDGARVAGFAAGALAVWRRAPFLVVVLVAGATAALVRLV